MLTPPSILVTFAVKEEARPFQHRLANASHICTLVTGMGRQNAERITRRVLDAARPDLLITAGFAGGLDPVLTHGSVLFEVDPTFPRVNQLFSVGAQLGRFHCAERIAITAAEKQAFRTSTGADAVEMESAVIRSLCRERGIPSATVRVISDTAAEDLPVDFNALVTPEGRPKPLSFALALLRQPHIIGELIRFQRRISRAAERLAEVLDKCCRTVA